MHAAALGVEVVAATEEVAADAVVEAREGAAASAKMLILVAVEAAVVAAAAEVAAVATEEVVVAMVEEPTAHAATKPTALNAAVKHQHAHAVLHLLAAMDQDSSSAQTLDAAVAENIIIY